MIKVTIVSTNTRVQKGVSITTQKPYSMTFQDAWLHTVDKDGVLAPYPQKVEIVLPRNDQGATLLFFPPGDYQLAPSAVYVDRFGKPQINCSRLVAIKSAAASRPTSTV